MMRYCREQGLKYNKSVPLLLGLLVLMSQPLLALGQKDDVFKESFSYINNNRLGERMSVSFPNGENDMAKSTEMTFSEEGFFNASTGEFDRRLIAVVTGMGLGNTGLKLVMEDQHQLVELKRCLKRFVEVDEEYRRNEEVIREKAEDWMGESWEAISKGREIGTVYFYPSQKALVAEFKWDLELERVWLSIGSRIMIERSVVPYMLHFVEHTKSYCEQFYEYRKTLVNKNQEIDRLLGVDSKS